MKLVILDNSNDNSSNCMFFIIKMNWIMKLANITAGPYLDAEMQIIGFKGTGNYRASFRELAANTTAGSHLDAEIRIELTQKKTRSANC